MFATVIAHICRPSGTGGERFPTIGKKMTLNYSSDLIWNVARRGKKEYGVVIRVLMLNEEHRFLT
jgi:hypothetical protein